MVPRQLVSPLLHLYAGTKSNRKLVFAPSCLGPSSTTKPAWRAFYASLRAGIPYERMIRALTFSFIKVACERLSDTERTQTPDGHELVYSWRVGSLMDGVYDWSRFNSLPQAFDCIQAELGANRDLKAKRGQNDLTF